MKSLESKTCFPCSANASKATPAEIDEWLSQLLDWRLQTVGDVQRLIRMFKFKTFQQALDFTNRVGAIAEVEQHHPQLITSWGEVTVSWWTHSIGGLHQNDFIMAAKTDRVFAG